MKIVNIVAIVKVKGAFNLTILAARINEIESSPKVQWLKMRLAPENYYIAFYKSGKFLVTGVKDFDQIDQVAKRVLARLKEAGIDADLESLTVHNIVATEKVDLNMTLEHLVLSLEDAKVSYEPEQFPGIFYKDDYGISYTLFSSGKLIITGVKDIEIARKGIEQFKAMITS